MLKWLPVENIPNFQPSAENGERALEIKEKILAWIRGKIKEPRIRACYKPGQRELLHKATANNVHFYAALEKDKRFNRLQWNAGIVIWPDEDDRTLHPATEIQVPANVQFEIGEEEYRWIIGVAFAKAKNDYTRRLTGELIGPLRTQELKNYIADMRGAYMDTLSALRRDHGRPARRRD